MDEKLRALLEDFFNQLLTFVPVEDEWDGWIDDTLTNPIYEDFIAKLKELK